MKLNVSEYYLYEIQFLSIQESSEQIVLFTGEEVVREGFEMIR